MISKPAGESSSLRGTKSERRGYNKNRFTQEKYANVSGDDCLAHLDGERSGLRPGSALGPRLRRLFHPGPDEEGPRHLGDSARENDLHLGHRLLQPLSLLHEHLWL